MDIMKRKVRYFRMNENQNEIQNENQEQSQEPHKHFLTLHISHKGQQKTLHFRIRHAVAVCAATVFLVGGSVCAVGAYQKTKQICIPLRSSFWKPNGNAVSWNSVQSFWKPKIPNIPKISMLSRIKQQSWSRK